MNLTKEHLMTLDAGPRPRVGTTGVEAGDTGIVEVSRELRSRLGILQLIF